MAHFKRVQQKERVGKIVYGDGIVDSIVLLAISEIDDVELFSNAPSGKMRSKAIKVNFDKNGVNIEIAVKIHFTQSVSDMAFKIQEAVKHNVEAMTEYKIASINVDVKGVMFTDKNTTIS